MTIVLSEGAISLMTTDELVKQSFASLKVSALEIRPGQSKTRAWRGRGAVRPCCLECAFHFSVTLPAN
jgi:uncharacterized oxidoreductase